MLSAMLLGALAFAALVGPVACSAIARTRSTGRTWRRRLSRLRATGSGPTASAVTCWCEPCMDLRVSLAIALAATLVSLVIGVAWGAIAGFRRGRTDALMMRLRRRAVFVAPGLLRDHPDRRIRPQSADTARRDRRLRLAHHGANRPGPGSRAAGTGIRRCGDRRRRGNAAHRRSPHRSESARTGDRLCDADRCRR